MKKILIFAALIPIYLSAQIDTIQTVGSQTESVGQFMIRDKSTNTYTLVIKSTNPYDNDIVRLKLGAGANEAAKSLASLHDTFYSGSGSFTLQGVTFDIVDKKLCARVAYAAGDLCIAQSQLHDEILTLIMDQGADYGELAVVQGYTTAGDYLLSFDTYGITDFVRVGFDISSRMSHQYNDFDTLTTDDVRVLRDAIKENYTSVTHSLLGLTVCDVILRDY